jgi:hypothetical protein
MSLLRKNILFRLSAVSGLVNAVFWAIGDVLIVGFTSNPASYPRIMETSLLPDKNFAALMVTGSTVRLATGALFGAFTIPLMFAALYFIYKLLTPAGRRKAVICVSVLFVGFAWSPLAHSSFFYFGEAVKAALDVDGASAARVFAMAALFEKFLYVVYFPAIGVTALGWLLATLIIARGGTGFPRWFALITPLPLTVAGAFLAPLLPPALSAPVTAAGINISGIIFYSASCVLCFRTAREDSKHIGTADDKRL